MAGFALPFALGATGATLGSTLFGKKSKVPSAIDVSGLRKLVTEGAAGQRQTIGGVRPELKKGLETFTTGVKGAMGKLGTERERLKSQFTSDIGQRRDVVGSKLFDTLRSRILRGVPGQEARLRETLSATGGLQRGAATEQLAQPTLAAGEQIGQAAEDIALQQLQQETETKEKLFNLDEQFLQQQFGVNKELLATALASGREDIIREAQTLINIADQETADLLEVEKFGLSGGLARESASRRAAGEESAAQFGAGSTLLASILPFLFKQGNQAAPGPTNVTPIQ